MISMLWEGKQCFVLLKMKYEYTNNQQLQNSSKNAYVFRNKTLQAD